MRDEGARWDRRGARAGIAGLRGAGRPRSLLRRRRGLGAHARDPRRVEQLPARGRRGRGGAARRPDRGDRQRDRRALEPLLRRAALPAGRLARRLVRLGRARGRRPRQLRGSACRGAPARREDRRRGGDGLRDGALLRGDAAQSRRQPGRVVRRRRRRARAVLPQGRVGERRRDRRLRPDRDGGRAPARRRRAGQRDGLRDPAAAQTGARTRPSRATASRSSTTATATTARRRSCCAAAR